jgi:hypothetical protein
VPELVQRHFADRCDGGRRRYKRFEELAEEQILAASDPGTAEQRERRSPSQIELQHVTLFQCRLHQHVCSERLRCRARARKCHRPTAQRVTGASKHRTIVAQL